MKLEDIGDAALVERIGKIVYAAFPQDKGDFTKWLAFWRADEQGAYHFGIFICDVVETPAAYQSLSDDERADIAKFQQMLTLMLDIIDLYSREASNG